VYRGGRHGLRERQQHDGQRPQLPLERQRGHVVAMCKGPNYTVLSMENMPTRGDMTMVRGPASVVIRCA